MKCKKRLRGICCFVLTAFLLMIIRIMPLSVSAYQMNGGIADNGLGGIWIDISKYPYNTYTNQYAYGPEGCAWFASNRFDELTSGMKIDVVWDAKTWWEYGPDNFGVTRSSQPADCSLICWNNHIAVLEKIVGDIAYISEGGVTSLPNNSYCHITTANVSEIPRRNVNFIGYLHIPHKAADPLTTPTVTMNKTSYEPGDTGVITWVHSNTSILSHYWVQVTTPDGKMVVNERVAKDATSYSYKFQTAGTYVITMSATPVGSVEGEGSLIASAKVTVKPRIKGSMLVTPDAGTGKTAITWQLTQTPKSVSISILDSKGKEAVKLNKQATDAGAEASLEAGSYTAVLSATDTDGASAKIDTVTFTVGGSQTWTYCSSLPEKVDPKQNTVEYKNYYEKVAVKSPGADWKDNGVAKTVWENTGAVYSNRDYPLETSDARVCVKEYFYHFCIPGGSFPCECNYAKTDRFSGYDEIIVPNADVIVYDQGEDDGHAYYLAKTQSGSKVVCGNGGQVWYKSYDYQDRVKVVYHSYTAESAWTNASDPEAKTVLCRYHSADGVAGDVNNDGKFNISDVVLVQNWLLAVPETQLKNWEAADFRDDNRLDAVDFCLMKKNLINS